MHASTLAARIILVVAFGIAALAKVRDHQAVAPAARALGLPPWAAGITARLLAPTELLTAALVAVRPTARLGAAVALVLLMAFTTVIVRTLRQGRRPACRCFGVASDRPIGPELIVRNIALAALAVVTLLGAA